MAYVQTYTWLALNAASVITSTSSAVEIIKVSRGREGEGEKWAIGPGRGVME